MQRPQIGLALVALWMAACALPDYVRGSSIRYSVTAIPSLAGYSMTPEALNAEGQVVGQTFGSSGYGTFYFNGVSTTTGPYGGSYTTNAVGITDSSTICGYGTTAGVPYIYTQTGSHVTNIASYNSFGVYPYAINNAGEIAGYGVDPVTGNARALLYSSSGYQNLGTVAPETSSYGFALNIEGDVIGIAAGVGAGKPFIYTGGAMHVIGSVGGRALGINDSRQVVGDIAGGNGSAFYYDYASNSFTTIAPPPGYTGCYLDGINNAGIAVGGSSTSSTVSAAIVFPGQNMTDINTLIDPSSGWHINSAVAINVNGQILGQGQLNGVGQVVILTPIPEPTPLSLFAVSGFGLLARRRRCLIVN
jgi:hypothetical protein